MNKVLKNAKWLQPSALFAVGLICASVLMLTQNSKASIAQQTTQGQTQKVAVIELAPVVVTAKRMSPIEKARYQQMLKTAAATII